MTLRTLQLLALSLTVCGPLAAQTPSAFDIAARSRGTPDIPGLSMVWLTPWSDPVLARPWRNIVVHQSEGPAGSSFRGAAAQAKSPAKRGSTIWVDTDGTAYWAVAEWAAPSHINGNRNDSRFVDNRATFHQMDSADTIGVEFAGNYPDVRRPVTEAQKAAWLVLVRVLQARYDIPTERIYAHAWIDYKDTRYCEGCELAEIARAQDVQGLQADASR